MPHKTKSSPRWYIGLRTLFAIYGGYLTVLLLYRWGCAIDAAYYSVAAMTGVIAGKSAVEGYSRNKYKSEEYCDDKTAG